LLPDGRRVTADLRDLDDDDGLARYYVSFLLEICHTTLDLLGETLSLNDIILGDETTQLGESRAINEAGLSTRHRIRHR
jgi:hypothetical protein